MKEVVKKSCGTDVDGLRFGKLVVLETLWDESPVKLRCLCDCGSEYIGVKTQITYGRTQSCGCFQKERASEANEKIWTGVISPYGVKFLFKHSRNKLGQWLWVCECGLCGKTFIALPAKINNGHITSCGCRARSLKEQLISEYLCTLRVSFIEQFSFNDCKHKQKLKYDFCVLINDTVKCLIEYDGKQHFEPNDYFGGERSYTKTILRDEIKNTYCKEHNLPLLRLPYYLADEEIKYQISKILNDCGVLMVT